MGIYNERDFGSIFSFFRGEKGYRRAKFFMGIFSIDKVNELYDRSSGYSGSAFAGSLLNDLGVNYVIGNAERLKSLPEGAFITVSNHPYGGLDGIILIDLIAGIREDYRFMVNRLLARAKAMKENFISVVPTGQKRNGVPVTNLHAIRETITHLHGGHPAGFFPSGAVSDFSLKELRVRDRQWQESILHLIHSIKVPVLPIRFFDGNSPFFYFLGLINWKIRNLRLPAELFNKRNLKPGIGIGNIITVEEQEQFADPETLGAFLRNTVYEMPLPTSFVPRRQGVIL